MSEYNHHLTNFDEVDVPQYQSAIEQSGCDIIVFEASYDPSSKTWDYSRRSVWTKLPLANLQAFWNLVQ